MFMSLANIRTNNIALAEIVGMLIKSKVSVNDAAPAIIEVVVDPSFMGKFDDIKNAVIKNKAGGVAFTINYSGRSPDEEFYRDYFESQYETPFKDSDIAFLSSMIAMLSEVYKGRVLDSIQGTNIEYGCLENYQRLHYVGEPFIVGGSLLCGEDVLVSPEYASNSCYMEMTLNGEAIKSGVLI
jgi:hypothetical protein